MSDLPTREVMLTHIRADCLRHGYDFSACSDDVMAQAFRDAGLSIEEWYWGDLEREATCARIIARATGRLNERTAE